MTTAGRVSPQPAVLPAIDFHLFQVFYRRAPFPLPFREAWLRSVPVGRGIIDTRTSGLLKSFARDSLHGTLGGYREAAAAFKQVDLIGFQFVQHQHVHFGDAFQGGVVGQEAIAAREHRDSDLKRIGQQ